MQTENIWPLVSGSNLAASRAYDDAISAVETPRLGEILVQMQKVSRRGLRRGLRLQEKEPRWFKLPGRARHRVRLGEALLKLRLVKERDIEEALARQFSFPCLQPGSNTGLSLELVAAYRPFSPEAEAFRSLRSRLLLHWFDEDRRTLAVVGPGRREGRSFVAANLAVAFAQMRIRTLLVDADLRRPRQDLVFNLPRHYGLSGVLGTPRNVNEVSGLPCLGDLHVVGAGAVPPNPLELLSREPFSKWLSRKAQQFQLVIIDTPAAALCTDTAVISAQSAGALMVARKDHTRLAEAQDLAEGLAVGGVPLAGTVLNHY